MIEFQASHSSRSASRSFASAALRIRTDCRNWLSCSPWAYRMPLAWALQSPPDRGMWMMRGDMVPSLIASSDINKPLQLAARQESCRYGPGEALPRTRGRPHSHGFIATA
jgi:hypothetical protein